MKCASYGSKVGVGDKKSWSRYSNVVTLDLENPNSTLLDQGIPIIKNKGEIPFSPVHQESHHKPSQW
jgi:hypothetical protein